jgi:hypothetical protein
MAVLHIKKCYANSYKSYAHLAFVISVCADTEVDLFRMAVCLESFRDAWNN